MAVKRTHEEKSALNKNNLKWISSIVKSGNTPSKIKDIPPIFIVLDLTWECNYDCRDCIDGGAAGRRPNMPKIPFEIIKDVMQYSQNNNIRGFMIMGGEVQLYEDKSHTIDDFLHLCADNSMPVSMVSNGSLLKYHLPSLKRAFSRPGSKLRVSINADQEHYEEHTRSEHSFDSVMESIKELSESGVKILVTTVVWGEGAYYQLGFENISQLRNIVQDCVKAGVHRILFIPSRNPETHANRYISNKDLKIMNNLLGEHDKTKVRKAALFSEYKENPLKSQDKSYLPCPSNLLRALIGSDCNLYACTDHRGEKDAIIGKIKSVGDFARVWHSEERVRRQMQYIPRIKCKKIPCMRYKLNKKLANAINDYEADQSDRIIEKLILPASKSFSF